MSKWILAFSLLTTVFSFSSAQYSVHFEDDTWEATKKKAQAAGKIIFIDGYTTWCEPCKMMDIQVFNRSKVARYFNRNFINYKMDMEKGSGPVFSVNYGVKEFPTFLFVTPDGTLVHKFDGYQHEKEMLTNAEPALNPTNRKKALDERYANGGRKPDFLYNYTYERLLRMDDSHKEVVKEYLDSQREWLTDKNIRFIYQFMEDIDSKMFLHMVSNRKRYEDLIGQEEVSRTIDIMVNNRIFNSETPPSIAEVDALYRLAYPKQGDKMAFDYKVKAFKDAGDIENYLAVSIDYYQKNSFNNLAQKKKIVGEIYDQSSNDTFKEIGYAWSKEIAKKENTIGNIFQVGLYEYGLNDKKRAKKTVKTALKRAKKSNDKQKGEIESLYKKIKKM